MQDVPRLDAEAFRQEAHRVADWMADYLRDLATYRVQPEVRPGEIRAGIPPNPPERSEGFGPIMADFERLILPGMTHWGHPRFYGYFPANTSPPSILAEMLTATLAAQCMSWSTSPAASELEQAMMEWLRQMLGLPQGFTGVIQDTASTATLVALITAREKALGRPVDGRSGVQAVGRSVDQLTVYTSEEANFSVAKGARLAGFRPEHIRRVETDAEAALSVPALTAAMERDREAGLVPCAVVATVGTTGSTAVDPVPAIAKLCRREGCWLHVDAAFAGSAAILPEMRWILDGVEEADSLVVNPHKWLLVNFDCSAYFVRDPAALLSAFSATAEYIKTRWDESAVNFRDWGIQLGRRFRSLKLWFVIRSYGVEGLRALLREHIRLGRVFAGWVAADPDFEVLGEPRVATVCFRMVRDERLEVSGDLDRANEELLRRLNATGRVFLTGTRLKGRYVLRLALGHLSTSEHQLRETWDLIKEVVSRR